MNRVCIINVVGLTPKLSIHAPQIAQLGAVQAWTSPIPAVTCTSQATMLTGLTPRKHGIVGNGWYFADTGEIRFWQQHSRLIQGDKLYDGIETAKMFWWFNQASGVRWSCTPKPHYGCDGSKAFDVLDFTDCQLVAKLGPFPFFAFWGPGAGLASSEWIAGATSLVMRQNKPQLTMVYLPHLDYDFQRYRIQDVQRVKEVDRCVGTVIEAARDIGAKIVVVSEYGLVPVNKAVMINQHLRRAGMLTVRDGPFGELLMPGESRAFAVSDHQIAHLYVNDPAVKDEVRRLVESLDGVACVIDPGELQLDHPRSGQMIALSDPDSWFAYYYWLENSKAPDFARCVDIHRKPGYDPCELFMTSKIRAAIRLGQKKLGMRYKIDVIPLDPSLVQGSHGLQPAAMEGPMIIGPEDPPDSMLGFKDYVRRLVSQ